MGQVTSSFGRWQRSRHPYHETNRHRPALSPAAGRFVSRRTGSSGAPGKKWALLKNGAFAESPNTPGQVPSELRFGFVKDARRPFALVATEEIVVLGEMNEVHEFVGEGVGVEGEEHL